VAARARNRHKDLTEVRNHSGCADTRSCRRPGKLAIAGADLEAADRRGHCSACTPGPGTGTRQPPGPHARRGIPYRHELTTRRSAERTRRTPRVKETSSYSRDRLAALSRFVESTTVRSEEDEGSIPNGRWCYGPDTIRLFPGALRNRPLFDPGPPGRPGPAQKPAPSTEPAFGDLAAAACSGSWLLGA
jgi:hypothetical protein